MSSKTKKSFQIDAVIASGVLTFITLILLYWLKELAPFGTKSLVVVDADIQYLDFFSYLKDVLNGENSIGYTFGKTLGGSNIAVFSYYLSSPFNLLLFFFDDMQLHTFFDITAALKLSLASMSFAYFSTHRFVEKSGTDGMDVICLLTAMGYGLSQYSIAQSSNIMWLDGVYMLPFILLQISNLARGRKSWPLPFLVGSAIIFNWYAAGIDCLFSGFWFLFELALRAADEKVSIRKAFGCAVKYVANMLLGVMMSAALFLPTIGALRKSTRGTLNLSDLLDFSFLGNMASAIQKYTYGAVSELGSTALFCGSLAIVLALYAIFSREAGMKKRLLYAVLLLGSILKFYWRPLFTVFSLLKKAESYYYRYSYIAIFSILFLAVIGGRELQKARKPHRLAIIAIIWATLQVVMYDRNPVNESKYVYVTIAMIIFETVLLLAARRAAGKGLQMRKCMSAAMVVVGILDLAFNANLLISAYSTDGVKQYQAYRTGHEQIISEIKLEDGSLYRISQTATRNMGSNGLTAYYNEGLSYNYASISGYTSSPDDIQRAFLNRLGYRINGENMCITNTSILGADSLLGVKYVLSSYPITGLVQTKQYESGKGVYTNPYAFPLAFTYNPVLCKSKDAGNPFEYQNTLFKGIFGRSKDLYSSVEYDVVRDEDGCGAKLRLKIPDATAGPVYGNIPWNYPADTSIYVNGEFVTAYACWLSPSVFYIQTDASAQTCEVEVRCDIDNYDWNSAQFYTLNLDVLKSYAEAANANQAQIVSLKNGDIEINAAKDKTRLFLSVPADSGWDITVNGNPADVELVGDCLYSIKLTDDVNTIKLKYHVEYLNIGVMLSLISILGYGIYLKMQRKKNA